MGPDGPSTPATLVVDEVQPLAAVVVSDDVQPRAVGVVGPPARTGATTPSMGAPTSATTGRTGASSPAEAPAEACTHPTSGGPRTTDTARCPSGTGNGITKPSPTCSLKHSSDHRE